MSAKVPIDVPHTVRELAQMTTPPMKTRSLRRRLLRWHHEYDETILVKIDGHWHCTIATLRSVWPSFGQKFAEQEDIDDLGDKVEKNTARIRSCEVGIKNTRAALFSCRRTVDEVVRILISAGLMRPEATTESA